MSDKHARWLILFVVILVVYSVVTTVLQFRILNYINNGITINRSIIGSEGGKMQKELENLPKELTLFTMCYEDTKNVWMRFRCEGAK